MNKYKKRIIKLWKDYGRITMYHMQYYRLKGSITDLSSACYFYQRYEEVYLLLNEHNI